MVLLQQPFSFSLRDHNLIEHQTIYKDSIHY
jgi:hypothetical protein